VKHNFKFFVDTTMWKLNFPQFFGAHIIYHRE
jgi:hypothetical protein